MRLRVIVRDVVVIWKAIPALIVEAVDAWVEKNGDDVMSDKTETNDLERVVHAVMPDGCEIVRYDRAGKWYIEGNGKNHQQHKDPRTKLTVDEAVSFALTAEIVYSQQYGGAIFYSRYLKRLCEVPSL